MKFQHTHVGDTKITKKFLWFPVRIDHETRWLEYATIRWRYANLWTENFWEPVEFLDSETTQETKPPVVEISVDEMQAEDFSPVSVKFLGLEGSRRALKWALDPSIDERPLGIKHWMRKEKDDGARR